MNRKQLLVDSLNEVASQSCWCETYNSYAIHVFIWQQIMNDDEEFTILNILDEFQVIDVKEREDIMNEPNPMLYYNINQIKLCDLNLSTKTVDKSEGKRWFAFINKVFG